MKTQFYSNTVASNLTKPSESRKCFATHHLQFLVAVCAFVFSNIVFLSVYSSVACAQQTTDSAFFETLTDVPIMSGFEELKDEALVFDKPSGRIGQAVAIGRDVSLANLKLFYEETLSQMGWHQKDAHIQSEQSEQSHAEKAKPLTFVRGSDQLNIYVETDQNDPKITVMRLYLTPR